MLDKTIEIYKEIGYPMDDFLDNYWEDIENKREIYGYINGGK